MTDKQKRFCDEYLIDLNGTRAYRAVYSNVKNDDTARANASRLLANANVKEYIEKRMKAREKRTEITQDMVLRELAAIAFSNGTDFARIVDKPVIVSVQQGEGEEATFSTAYKTDPDTGKIITYKDVEMIKTSDLSEDKKKAVAGIKMGKNGIELATCDKVKALELLGRHLGMFNDRLAVTSQQEEEKNKKLDAITGLLEQMHPDNGGDG